MLREIRFFSVRGVDGKYYVQIEAAGIGRDVVDNLLSKQGNFEAKILKPIELDDNTGTIMLGEKEYTVSVSGNETIKVENLTIDVNETFTLNDVEFELSGFIVSTPHSITRSPFSPFFHVCWGKANSPPPRLASC